MIDYFECYYTFIFFFNAPITFKSGSVSNMHSHDNKKNFDYKKNFSTSSQHAEFTQKSSACLAKYLSNREV